MTTHQALQRRNKVEIKTVSLNALMIAFLTISPLWMVYMVAIGDAWIYDWTNVIATALTALALIVAIKFNARFKNPVLSILIFTFVAFWQFRYFSLIAFDGLSLTLDRTVVFDSMKFFSWQIWTLLMFLASFFGIILGQLVWSKNCVWMPDKSLGKSISWKSVTVFAIAAICYFAMLVFAGKQVVDNLLPYSGLIFQSDFTPIALVALFLFSKDGNHKYLAVILIVSYIIFTIISGSRSGLITMLMFYLSGVLVLGKNIIFRRSHLLFIVGVLLPLAILIFIAGTFQRHLRTDELSSITFEKIYYVASNVTNLQSYEDVKHLVGIAFARAGFTDFGAEIYINKEFDDAVNIEVIAKSIIDNSIPGDVFADGRRLGYRLRDVYFGKDAEGYQSDIVTAPAELYRTFGWAGLVVMAFIAFCFSIFYQALPKSILGVFLRILLCVSFVNWWGGFGFDWFFIEFSRSAVLILLLSLFIFPSMRNNAVHKNNFVRIKP